MYLQQDCTYQICELSQIKTLLKQYSTRHGLMLLWFTDLMNVTEKVTIHRQTFRHSCLVPSSEVI